MSNINEQLNRDTKQYGSSSRADYFKFNPGDNRLRVLTSGEVLATHFFGKGQKASTCYGIEEGCPYHGDNAPKDTNGKEKRPSIKYTCYVVDVNDKDNKIQLADLPYSVIKQIGDYQANQDYAFDSFPMPYDVTIKFDPDSKSPNDMYKVIPSPKRTTISADVEEKLNVAMSKVTPEQSVQRKKDWQQKEHRENGLLIPQKSKEEKRSEYIDEARKTIAKQAAESDDIEYPSERINPEDIPF